MRAGVVGCGVIGDVCLRNCASFYKLEVVACSVGELLDDAETVSLTVPRARGPVALAAVGDGKSVHNGKPVAIKLDEVPGVVCRLRARHLSRGRTANLAGS